MSAKSTYFIFEECCSYTTDAYWKDLLHACSNNKFPKGLRYDELKNKLYVRADSKTDVITLPSDSHEVFTLMMSLFTTKLGLISPSDTIHMRENMVEMLQMDSLDDVEWKAISKSKLMKELLVSAYVEKLASAYELSPKECKTLFSLVNLGFQFKKICAEDVTFANGQIEDIKGLMYDEQTRVFTVTGDCKVSSKASKTSKTDPFYKGIDSYLKEYMARTQS